MKTHNTLQGSQEWLTLRARYLTASEAPAMMGCSPYATRSALLEQKSTGLLPDIDAGTAKRFENGHAVEHAYRPLAEALVGEDLYPVTGSLEVQGLPLLASFDGLSMDESIVFEHKAYNAKTASYIEANGEPPIHHVWQLEQQLLVAGAQKALFVTSDGTDDTVSHCWYTSQPERRATLIAGWQQFQADMQSWQPQERADAAPVGRTPETLPALHIEVTGMVTASNLAEYKAHALAVFASINRELMTDAQFADAEKTVRWCSDIEARLAAAKQHALSQTESIDALFRTIDDISAEARATRLELDKLVKNRKDSIRAEIVADGRNALASHMTSLNGRIGNSYMPPLQVDFAAVIKGKRTLDSMRDAVDTELARAKIAANEVADRITLNLRAIHDQTDFAFLFSDVATLVLKEPEFVAMVIKNRISEHHAKEAARVEAQRLQIEATERAKAQAEERARADAEIAAATAKARAETHAQAQADAQAKRASDEAARASAEAIAKAQAEQSAPAHIQKAPAATETVAHQTPVCEIVQTDNSSGATSPLSPPTLRLGQICERLGFTLTADFMRQLGFEPAATDKAARLYHEQDFPRICAVLVRHIKTVCQGVPA